MKLQSKEQIVKVFHHHPFPFLIQLIKAVSASFPFFFLLYLFSPALPYNVIIIANLAIIVMFSLVILYMALIFWFDRLVITNKRALHVDWVFMLKRVESEALLYDIQDIYTQEQGILSAIPLFDYGIIKLETASSKTTITFMQAPDPEGIKAFIKDHIEACRPNTACDVKPIAAPAIAS
ncbi:hypothetical protein C0416_03090 [bacterium]|nr:hypothetical protein [bacterium]